MNHNELEPAIRILGDINASLIALDLEGYITGWNGGAERLFGYRSDEVIGQHILILYADEAEADAEIFNRVILDGQSTLEVRRKHKNGHVFWAQIHLTLVRDEQGRPLRMVGFLYDISRQVADQIRSRLLNSVFKNTPDAILITDEKRHLIECNPAYLQMMGSDFEHLRGQVPQLLSQCELLAEIDAHLISMGHWEGELWTKRVNGDAFPIWLSISQVCGRLHSVVNYFAVIADLTEKKAAEEQIFRLVYFDALTKLPNRSHFFSLLEQSLVEAKRQQNSGALLCFNIVGFKAMNDSFTHRGGDQILIEVAARIRSCLRDEDVLARFGADEFSIGLFDIKQREDAAIVTERILTVVAAPYYIMQEEIVINAHIGISVYPEDGHDPDKLLNYAAMAMNRARLSHHPYMFYSVEMNQRSLVRLKLSTDLHHAIERNEFRLFYQPQVNAKTGCLCGAEALIRWQHPHRGLLGPAEFIPFAEETGLIVQIGTWVLSEACRQLAQWQAQGLHLERLAVNLSPRQFSKDLIKTLQEQVSAHQISASQIELEITETLLMQIDDGMVGILHDLHALGFSLALDDFGTGYSNLAYLHTFPLDYLKIDQRFVRGVPSNDSNVAIVKAIIAIAMNLNLQLIAEGVENQAEADFMSQLDCHQLQGFYMAQPLPVEQFSQLLTQAEQSLLPHLALDR